MKVLLTQDVYNLGHAGEIKAVADGYGRNYLIPRGLAVPATPTALKRADAVRTTALKRRAQEQTDIEATSQVIGGVSVFFSARTGEKGKLFGSITGAQIAAKLSEILGKEFDKRKVALREPIRDIGTHVVTIRLSADVAPTVNVVVTPEGVAPTSPAVAQAVPTAVPVEVTDATGAETPTEPAAAVPAESAPEGAA